MPVKIIFTMAITVGLCVGGVVAIFTWNVNNGATTVAFVLAFCGSFLLLFIVGTLLLEIRDKLLMLAK